MAVALHRDGGAWTLAPLIVSLVVSTALVAVPVIVVVARASEVRAELPRAARGLGALLSTLALVTPALLVVNELASKPGVPFALACGSAAAIACACFWFGLRSGVAGFFTSYGAAWFALELQKSLNVLSRLNPGSVDGVLKVALFSGAIAPGLAILVFVLGRSVSGSTPSRRVAAASTAAGAIAVALGFRLPETYPTSRAAAFGAGVLLVAIAFRRLELARSPRLRLCLAASIVSVPLATSKLASPVGRTGWALTHDTEIAALVAAKLGLFRGGFEELRSALLARPEAARGAALGLGAAAWNRDAERLPRRTRARSVVFITIDTLRYDHVGYSGKAPSDLTPSLDRLASRAARFHRCYAQASHTALSLPSAFFSRYPHSLRFGTYLGYWWSTKVYPEEPSDVGAERAGPLTLRSSVQAIPSPSLPELVRDAGLRTISVTNDGEIAFFIPEAGYTRGFQRAIVPRTEVSRRSGRPVRDVDDASTVGLALEALKDVRGPFFLWVHLISPHYPYDPPPSRGRFSGYEGEVHASDAAVGTLLDALDARGHREDTIVVAVADHGEELDDHGDILHGQRLFEESIRIPCLVAVPGEAPRDVDAAVGLIDVAPTILQELGMPIPPSMEGFSLVPVLRRAAERPRPPVVAETWRFEGKGPALAAHQIGVTDGRWKVILDERQDVFSMYDLEADPAERVNLVGTPAYADVFASRAAFLLGWDQSATVRGAEFNQPERGAAAAR
jgi:arylsulfatase A-like enzyme